jgi:TetR/AcrR family transcriptional repressor of nem operon
MPNTRGASTRERVIEEAAALIREKGFRSTSIGDVLERAGVQKGSFYYYFPSKEDLGHAVLARWTAELRSRLLDFLRDGSHGVDPLDRIAAALDGFVRDQDATGCRGGCPFGNLAIELADVDEGFRVPLSQAFRELAATFADLLREAREAGALRPEADPDRLGVFLVAAIEGGILLAKVHRDCEPLRASLAEAEAHVASFRTQAQP